jgi:integrase/recombinase XerD
MKVQRAKVADNQYTWLVLADDYLPIEPIHQFIIYLENLDRSPYTIRSYAYHLKLFWQYLEKLNVSWKAIKLDTLANFIHWLKLGESNKVIKLYPNESKRQNTSINSILASIISFYQFHERLGNIEAFFGESSVSVGGSRRFKPLLHHISKHKPYQRQLIKMKEPDFVPKTLNKDQIKTLFDACKNTRDLFLLKLLNETGMRIGQALGLQHCDIKSWDNEIHVSPRQNNANLARSKSIRRNILHTTKSLMALYSKYLMDDCGELISDYVFICLHGTNRGKPLTYNTVKDMFRRLSRVTGIHVSAHMFRHTHATQLITSGWDSSMVQKRLGHAQVQTTLNTYIHIDQQQMKQAFDQYQNSLKEKDDE